ncbi:DM13 domain-containing protein [Tamlana sp. s12]|uniref:DM13 domain-containing protein n=1 Tax=Tamlana sp. s12 TaxID=1630406 RepID=UPI0007FCF4CA|nr:DM13 domain-containing protein [Tamlana sp. s12]OBQ52837.1 hypothetical protein VQ01_12870 [Tamlana sp. s12]QQY81139.1 DM13 domain-containing protein [Tamlana sp. s12]
MKTYLLLFLSVFTLAACSSDDDSNDSTDDMIPEKASYRGEFESKAHPTSGIADINEEHTLLNLTNFKSDDGPSLELYLATDEDATKYISLGSLKGLDGNYEYATPEDIDFSEYDHVIVWCVPFGVNFGQAVLEMN